MPRLVRTLTVLERAAGELVPWFARAAHGAIPALLVVAGLAVAWWIWFARGLPAAARIAWLTVPLLALAALACLLGPGRWFPKHPFEGAVLIEVSGRHGLTTADLAGLTCAVAAFGLGCGLARRRFKVRPSRAGEGDGAVPRRPRSSRIADPGWRKLKEAP